MLVARLSAVRTIATMEPPPAHRIGFSTGALARGDVDAGVSIASTIGRHRSCGAVELSSLHADELDSVEAAARNGSAAHLGHVSVHAPVKGDTSHISTLTARLGLLDVAVVAHPDAMRDQAGGDLRWWSVLGDRLLIENNDGRKQFGARVDDLAECFDALPDAHLCLDVAHALHAGGQPLLDGLLDAFGDRVALVHVGCGCGQPVGWELDAALCDAAAHTIARLDHHVPVIIERSLDAAPSAVLFAAYDTIAAALNDDGVSEGAAPR
jgi:hypothetical protein